MTEVPQPLVHPYAAQVKMLKHNKLTATETEADQLKVGFFMKGEVVLALIFDFEID